MPVSTEERFFPKQDLSRLVGQAIMKKQLLYTNICLVYALGSDSSALHMRV